MIHILRMVLPTVALLLLLVSWSAAVDLRPNIPEGSIEVTLDIVVQYSPPPDTEFTPIDIVPFNDGTGRLAVSTVLGTIRVIDSNDQFLADPLLTRAQSGLVPPQEAGMTGIAFHPDFNHPGSFGYGKLYTITTEPSSGNGGLPNSNVDFPFNNENFQDVVREWDLHVHGNVPGNEANGQFTGGLTDSREILRVSQPGPFHNIADLAFDTHAQPGDDSYGLLYITSGDGGSGHNRFATAQDLSTIYGNILRIDPNPAAHPLQRTSANSGLPSYSIPSSNPFNGDDAVETTSGGTLAEIFAYGVRSPFRLNFDRDTGDLYLGEVGENAIEEINLITSGGNFGWGRFEGTLLRDENLLLGGPSSHTEPIIELAHTDSRSIAGGFVYRGSAIPELQGKYVFGDLGQGFSTGALFYAIVDPNDPEGDLGDVFEFQISDISPTFDDLPLPTRIFSIGEDENGELYFSAGPDPRRPFNPDGQAFVVRLRPGDALSGVPGDINQDGILDDLDVNAFIANWKSTGHINAFEQITHGDLNQDGITDLLDAFILHQAFAAQGGAFPFEALWLTVPEPTSLLLLSICAISFGASRPRRDP